MSTTKSSTVTDVFISLNPAESLATSENSTKNEIAKLWAGSKANIEKAGETRVFYDLQGKTVAVVSTGKVSDKGSVQVVENRLKEVSRRTAALGLLSLKGQSSTRMAIDPVYSPHAAAVGSHLASWVWNLKSTTSAKALLEPVEIECLGSQTAELSSEKAHQGRIALDWNTGTIYAKAQNMARELMETPANLMTPTSQLYVFYSFLRALSSLLI
jgi:aminopeptidase